MLWGLRIICVINCNFSIWFLSRKRGVRLTGACSWPGSRQLFDLFTLFGTLCTFNDLIQKRIGLMYCHTMWNWYDGLFFFVKSAPFSPFQNNKDKVSHNLLDFLCGGGRLSNLCARWGTLNAIFTIQSLLHFYMHHLRDYRASVLLPFFI